MRRIHGAAALAVGLPCGAAGAALMKHGGFGLTPFYTVSLALYHVTGLWTMGTWNVIFQTLLILSLIVILRRMKPRYLLSFAVAAVSSAILDGANAVCATFSQALPIRILCYATGFLVMTFGIALMAECKMPVAPMNLFVRELAESMGKPFRRVKLVFDVACFTVSVTILFAFAGHLDGIGPGTIISALLTGPMSGVYIATLRKKYIFYVRRENW